MIFAQRLQRFQSRFLDVVRKDDNASHVIVHRNGNNACRRYAVYAETSIESFASSQLDSSFLQESPAPHEYAVLEHSSFSTATWCRAKILGRSKFHAPFLCSCNDGACKGMLASLL